MVNNSDNPTMNIKPKQYYNMNAKNLLDCGSAGRERAGHKSKPVGAEKTTKSKPYTAKMQKTQSQKCHAKAYANLN
jgi:hypothetical protein